MADENANKPNLPTPSPAKASKVHALGTALAVMSTDVHVKAMSFQPSEDGNNLVGTLGYCNTLIRAEDPSTVYLGIGLAPEMGKKPMGGAVILMDASGARALAESLIKSADKIETSPVSTSKNLN